VGGNRTFSTECAHFSPFQRTHFTAVMGVILSVAGATTGGMGRPNDRASTG